MRAAFITLFVATVINFSLGFFVYIRDRNGRPNQLFFLMTLAVVGWTISNFATNYPFESISYNEIANRFAYFFGFLIALFGLAFTYVYPVSLKRSRTEIALVIITTFIVLILSFTNLIAGHVVLEDKGLHYYPGSLILLYVLGFLGLVALSCRNMFYIILHENPDKVKSQAKFILVAFAATGVLGILMNLVLPIYYSDWTSTNFGPLATILLVGLIAYTMVKHGLFDIRLFFVRATAYTITTLALGVLYVGPVLFITFKLLDIEIEPLSFLIILFTGTILATNYGKLKTWFNKTTNRFFFRDAYDAQGVINNINSTLVHKLKIETLLETTSKIIEKELKISFVDFYLDPRASIVFHIAGSNTNLFSGSDWSDFEDLLSRNQSKILLISDNTLDKSVTDLMRTLDIECVVKMISSNENVGFMLLGPRKSGNDFGTQDIQLLEIIADEVAIAVQNALRFEEISQFNVTLQQKIDSATQELQQTNKKLKSLDEAKDEFISMASHQLRTPLTSIKGYISMMLEGDAGELNDQQKNFLNQAFISSQRMVFLISDLLNVSRLKTGKFVIEKSEVYLPDMVKLEIEQLTQTAEARGLTLEYKPPKEFPKIQLDETKTLQVIMNFIDNAIYYTPKGGKIKVELTADNNSVTYKVIDNGIGVPKTVQHELFTKFYRAENAKKARPDGTGLGLYMAKKVIIAQGGHLIFKSEEGKGSTFGFSFPLNNNQPPEDPESTDKEQ